MSRYLLTALLISIYSWKDNSYSTGLSCDGELFSCYSVLLVFTHFSVSNTPCTDRKAEDDLIFNYSSLSSIEHLKDLRSDSEADVSPWPLRRLTAWKVYPQSHKVHHSVNSVPVSQGSRAQGQATASATDSYAERSYSASWFVRFT